MAAPARPAISSKASLRGLGWRNGTQRSSKGTPGAQAPAVSRAPKRNSNGFE
jgi:hypothetical protein